MDWYPWYYIQYKGSTLSFTLAEDGAYRRLIDHYMETREPLPSNPTALCRILGIGNSEFLAIANNVLSKFTEIDNELHNDKCNIELNRQDSLSKKRSNAQKKSAIKRKKNNMVLASAKQEDSNCNDTGQDKRVRKKEDTNVSSKENKFDEFWILFPRQRRGNKSKAKTAYERVLKSDRATEIEIINGVKNYEHSNEVKTGYAKGAEAWLNDDRWTVDYSGNNEKRLNAVSGKSGNQGIAEVASKIAADIRARDKQSQSDLLQCNGELGSDDGGVIIDHEPMF